MKDTQVDLSLGLHRSCTLVSIAEYIKKNDIASSRDAVQGEGNYVY